MSEPVPATDDLGLHVAVPPAVRRVVSLVPSLTEAVAATAPELLVGATDWCTHPAGLDVARVRGTKNPDVAAVLALRPDVVLVNEEENRPAGLDALRAGGVAVWVTAPRTVEDALGSLARMLAACGLGRPEWLEAALAAWAPYPAPGESAAGTPAPRRTAVTPDARRAAVVPIWRRPWMVLGRDTFAGDVLARLGVDNVYRDHVERYPRVPLEELRAAAPDIVVLPDEPYAFAADDGPEAFPGTACALVSGRHLTWYGPSLADAPTILVAQLAAARPSDAP